MPKNYSPQQFFVSIIAAVLVAGIVGYFVGRSTVPAAPGSSKTANISESFNNGQSVITASPPSDTAEGMSAIISDQAAGDQVLVKDINFKKGGWLAIYEDRDGLPGNIIGARYFPAGLTADAAVDLLRPTVKGRYYARFHKDNGDHQFDLKVDFALLDSSGNPVTLRFTVN